MRTLFDHSLTTQSLRVNRLQDVREHPQSHLDTAAQVSLF